MTVVLTPPKGNHLEIILKVVQCVCSQGASGNLYFRNHSNVSYFLKLPIRSGRLLRQVFGPWACALAETKGFTSVGKHGFHISWATCVLNQALVALNQRKAVLSVVSTRGRPNAGCYNVVPRQLQVLDLVV